MLISDMNLIFLYHERVFWKNMLKYDICTPK
jgi:hypothetical protein